MSSTSRRFAELKSKRDVDTLIASVQRLSMARTLEEVADIVKKAALALSKADGATFVLPEDGNCYYMDEDAIGPLWKGKRFPLSACISGWVMHNRIPAVISDITTDDRIPQAAYEHTFVKSLVMVPVRTLDPMAAIGIYWQEKHQTTSLDVDLLQALADSAAIAMENVRLYQELEQRVQVRTVELEHANADLRTSNAQLQAALDKIENLEHLVRKCAWTNQFELNGEWMSVESYLQRRFGLTVSHGLSDEALNILQRELETRAPKSATPSPVATPVPA